MARAKVAAVREEPAAPLPASTIGDKGFVIVQPLHWLSELQQEVTALQLEVGRAYAVGISQSWPRPEMLAGLRARLERSLRLVGHAERMDAGPAALFPEGG